MATDPQKMPEFDYNGQPTEKPKDGKRRNTPPTKVDFAFAERLKAVRARLGVSQEALGKKLDRSSGAMYAYENAKYHIPEITRRAMELRLRAIEREMRKAVDEGISDFVRQAPGVRKVINNAKAEAGPLAEQPRMPEPPVQPEPEADPTDLEIAWDIPLQFEKRRATRGHKPYVNRLQQAYRSKSRPEFIVWKDVKQVDGTV